MKKSRRDWTREEQLAHGPIDLPYLMLTVLLLGIGLVMLLSASSYSAAHDSAAKYEAAYYFKRQLVFAVAGLIVMFFISKINYQHYRKWSFILLFLSIALLVLVLVPGLGTTSHNATRWLKLGPVSFQPSEAVKIAVVLHFAACMSNRRKQPERKRGEPQRDVQGHRQGISVLQRADQGRQAFLKWIAWDEIKELIPYVLTLGVVIVLLAIQPHLSAAILIIIAAAALFWAAGYKLRWFLLGGGTVAVGVFVILVVIGYNGDRIKTWLDPWWDPSHESYQILQSLYAVASGGLTGQGLGLSRQKYLYLPEEQNDFIFSIVAEELGFIGCAIIVILFALLILRGYWLALHARDRFGTLIIVGLNTLLAAQVFLNIAVVTNLIPATGISLPFFSYGGTALMIQLAAIGIILSVSRQIPAPKQG